MKIRVNNPPNPENLMKGARSYGNYDLPAALADLVDNSISAKSKNIYINFIPIQKGDLVVTISDDGCGFDGKDALILAMQVASRNPEDEIESNELGRFGWGLKTASLSQASVITVVSWKDQQFIAARWDHNNCKEWGMDYFDGDDAKNLLLGSPKSKSGTQVIWSNCDRLLESQKLSNIDEISPKIEQVNKELSLIFHRYLLGDEQDLNKINIEIQGVKLLPQDPFMQMHPATQTVPEQVHEYVTGKGKRATFKFQLFVIPHFSRLSHEELVNLGGEEGFFKTQGFYVYRNKRLIIHGTWFKIIKFDDINQLIRIRIDLPNALDGDWKITLDKADAQMPSSLKPQLKEIIRKFSEKTKKTNRRNGIGEPIKIKGTPEPVWIRRSSQSRYYYTINREHPLINDLLDLEEVDVSNILGIIESYVPIEAMIKERSNLVASTQVQPPINNEEFDIFIKMAIKSYERMNGKLPTFDQFKSFSLGMEPFSSHWKYMEEKVIKMINESRS